MSAGTPIERNGWRLVNKADGAPIGKGELVRGYNVTGGAPPHKEGASGYVDTFESGQLYAHVLGLCWIHPTLRPDRIA